MILAVTSSLFLALTIIPALTAKFQSRNFARTNWWHTGISLPWLKQRYGKTIAWTTARPLWGIGLALLLPIAGFIQVLSFTKPSEHLF